MTGPDGLRRATAADVPALVALQEAAYAPNRAIIGSTPIPLQWDYAALLETWEVWLADDADGLAGALILQVRPDDLYIENVSVAPRAQGTGLGNRLLSAAEARAADLGRSVLRLLTSEKMVRNIDWYARHGYAVEFMEDLADRRLTHMVKRLGA